MSLTIYGKKQTRAGRCLWVLEELGLAYDHVPTDAFAGEARTAEHLALNPMGKVPVLDDDGYVLTESVAIGAYLAMRQPTPLWPDDAKARAEILRWSSWVTTEVEFHFTTAVREMRRAAPDQARIAEAMAALPPVLAVMEQRLAESAFLAGDAFTLADINVAFILAGLSTRIDMAPFPATARWLETCLARPAWQRVQALA